MPSSTEIFQERRWVRRKERRGQKSEVSRRPDGGKSERPARRRAFDSLQEDGVPEDRRTATGIDALGADLSDGSNTGVRRIPGNQQVSALARPLLGRCLPIFTDFSDFLGRLHPRQT